MKRKEFIKTCGWGCAGLMVGMSGLSSCVGTQHLSAELKEGYLMIPLDAFLVNKKGKSRYRSYVVAHHESLQYPIGLFRFSNTEYEALWMRCTHQGTELQIYGDRLQCPAHGSEFSNTGSVENGPADDPLRTFPVNIESNTLKIDLR